MSLSQSLALAEHRLHAWAWARTSPLRRRGRPFPRRAARRLLIVSLPDPIAQSQIFPFHFFAGALRERWGYEVREIGLAELQAAPERAPRDADVVCFQAWIDKTPAQLREIAALLRRQHPEARLVFLDLCAPTDVRFASVIGDQVDLYVKKHALRDRGAYLRPTLGDTNLAEWYGQRYGEVQQPVLHALPDGFLDKLVVGPSFVTAPYMLPSFSALDRPPAAGVRRFDLHARLGGAGAKGWYPLMRTEAKAAVRALQGVAVTPDGAIGKRAYLRELAASKTCFSPFGYGEVCWRDYEAAHAGAALIKPDMSHVETVPDLFVAGETYLPLRWDFADLPQVLDRALSDDAARRRLVENAWATLHDFAHGFQFLEALERVFLPEARPRAAAHARDAAPHAGHRSPTADAHA